MIGKLRTFFSQAPHANLSIAGTLLASCVIGTIQAVRVNSGEWDSPVALILLAFVSTAAVFPSLEAPIYGRFPSGWVLLAAAAVLLFSSFYYDSTVGASCALLLNMAAVIAFAGSLKYVVKCLFPLTASLLLLPFQENWTLFFSYPLRLISTLLSVSFFELFGVQITAELTTIRLGQAEIAITDACSGVSQLGVLLFFAYLLSRTLRCGAGAKALWVSFILPIVIFANTVRLALTIGLYLVIGEKAFDNAIHISLGYFFVAFSLLLLWWSRKLIPPPETEEEQP